MLYDRTRPTPRRAGLVATLAAFVLLLAALPVPPAHAAVQATIYVSPTGSDAAAGTLGAPIKTLGEARSRVDSINDSMTGDIEVVFRGGTYPFTSSTTFGPADSGTNGFSVKYLAYPDEIPVFDGGTPVTGWTLHSGNIWVADLSRASKLRTLYVNGERATLARSAGTQTALGGVGSYSVAANGTWAMDSGSTYAGISLAGTGLPASFTHQADMEIVNQSGFSFHVVGLASVATSGSNRIATLQQPMGAIALSIPQAWGSAFLNTGNLADNHFYLQNAYELLDQDNEFYFDRSAGKLYFYKPAGMAMSSTSVVAPTAEKFLTIAGTSTSDRVHDLSFSGIVIRNTHWGLLSVAGSVGATTVQSNALYSRYWSCGNWHSADVLVSATCASDSSTLSGYANTSLMPSAIEVSNAQRVEFSDNAFSSLGSGALTLGNDTVDTTVVGNRFVDISGSAITVGSPYNTYIGDGDYPSGVEGVPTNITVRNNAIDRAGAEFLQTVPIAAYYADGLNISHNEVTRAPYTGISVGWGFNSYNHAKPAGSKTTVAGDNHIDDNIVRSVMTRLHDGGAIYTLGAQPGSTIRGNLIEQTGGASFGNPIYTDQSSSGIEIADNVIDDYNGTWWFVWGSDAHVSGLDVHDNVVNASGLTEAALLSAGTFATSTTVSSNRTGWTTGAQATTTTAGLEPAYRDLRAPGGGIFTRNTIEAETGVPGGRARTANDGSASGGAVIERLDLVGDKVSFPNVAAATGIAVRYASTSAGTMGVYVGGTRAASLSFVSTGAWFGSFATASVPVSIPSGATVTLQNDAGDTGFNLDTMTFNRAISTHIEAESGVVAGGATACATGTGTYNQSSVCQLDLIGRSLTVTSPVAGTSLSLRYSAPAAGVISVYVNGVDKGNVSFASTGGWYANWARATLVLPIPAGATIQIKNDAGDTGLNVDSIRID